MTIKEAILQALDDLKKPSKPKEIYNKIGSGAKYNQKQISDAVWNLAKKDDRVKSCNFGYYLSKYEQDINFDNNSTQNDINQIKTTNSKESYNERDLHKLLSTYLHDKGICSKTILHEESKNSKDNHQKWIHPDMIGIEFLNLTSKVNKAFMKILNKADTLKITSYEIKKEINTDYELKKSYFQAVSNSSWANYGYLVALEISDNLKDEMERLNQSFGIGIIELKSNPYESRILFQAKFKELDFKTIDKLCKVNEKYEKFIELTERILTIDERNYKSIENEFNQFCDDYFTSDSQIEQYCKDKYIPYDNEELNE
jgi:hypothetical protein